MLYTNPQLIYFLTSILMLPEDRFRRYFDSIIPEDFLGIKIQ